MKKIIIAGLLLLGTVATANATVLTFEDVPGANPNTNLNPIGNGYGGLNWSNMYVLAQGYHPGSGYDNGQTTVGGSWIAYNAYASMAVTMAGGADFDFNGAFFTSAWSNGNILTVNAFNDNVLVNSTSMILNTATPQWLSANFMGVDRLEFTSSNAQFVMDDFTYNGAPVPEPSTFFLLGAGLGGFALLRKRAKK